jgi:hypothetical protein
MVFFWLASILFLGLLALLFRVERKMLHERRARRRALIIDAVRLTAVGAMFLALPVAEPRPLATIGLGLAAFAFVAIPSSWMLAIGGQDQKWELKRLQEEAAGLMTSYPSPMPADGAARLRRLTREIGRLRTAETEELCRLLSERYQDWIDGSSRPLELGRRAIRIYDLQRDLYPDDVRPTELSEAEATFRWRLYRTVMAMAELGTAEQTPEQESRFRELVAALDGYRRADTSSFIGGVQTSARAWLQRTPPRNPWTPAAGLPKGKPTIDDMRPRLWPRTSTFWGAILDEEDRLALRQAREAGSK